VKIQMNNKKYLCCKYLLVALALSMILISCSISQAIARPAEGVFEESTPGSAAIISSTPISSTPTVSSTSSVDPASTLPSAASPTLAAPPAAQDDQEETGAPGATPQVLIPTTGLMDWNDIDSSYIGKEVNGRGTIQKATYCKGMLYLYDKEDPSTLFLINLDGSVSEAYVKKCVIFSGTVSETGKQPVLVVDKSNLKPCD
jgi:hypothetical protein